jgi:putative ABC transport system ATP-binding protein
MGPSGSVKSTLMMSLLSGAGYFPTSGSYVLNKEDVSRMSENELAEIHPIEAGFVLRRLTYFLVNLRLDNVALPLSFTQVTIRLTGQKAQVAQALAWR